jgi:DNA-binding XRE family transcriptional regulator
MGNIFLKRRSLYMFYYWCNRTLPEAEFRYQMADAALKNNVIADEDLTKIEKEKNDAFKELLAYKSFLAELTDVEKEIVYSPKEPNNAIAGIRKEQFEEIRLEVFKKWCVKFLPSNIVYIREIDRKKMGAILKEARHGKGYSAVEVGRYLGISSGALRNYESGARLPGVSVLYALCKIFGIDILKLVERTFTN